MKKPTEPNKKLKKIKFDKIEKKKKINFKEELTPVKKENIFNQTIQIGETGSFTGICVGKPSSGETVGICLNNATQTSMMPFSGLPYSMKIRKAKRIEGRTTFTSDIKKNGWYIMENGNITIEGIQYLNTKEDPITADQSVKLTFPNYNNAYIQNSRFKIPEKQVDLEIEKGLLEIKDKKVFINGVMKFEMK